MRLRHGLRRLRRTVQVTAVAAAAVAVSATALNATPTHGMRRVVWVFRQQRRVPGRWAWLAYRPVRHAGTVRLWHGLHGLWTALLSSAIATTLTTATVPTAITSSTVAAAVATASFTVTTPAVTSAAVSTALTA